MPTYSFSAYLHTVKNGYLTVSFSNSELSINSDMQLSKIYLYHQRHRVILLDTTGDYFTKRYRQVYTKNLKAHRGTDNQILIEFVNQDQKPVDITGLEFTCRIIDREGEFLMLEKLLVIVNAERGQAKLVLTESELDAMHPQRAHFSIERTDNSDPDNLYEPVYVDDDAGARGNIELLDSIMPQFVESGTLTVPDIIPAPDYMSSMLETNDQELYTFQLLLDDFVGDIEAQGGSIIDNTWYTIDSFTFTNETGPAIFNVTGYHPYIRLSITNNTNGKIDEIRYR